MISGRAPPGIADSRAGFATTSSVVGGSFPRRSFRNPGASSRCPDIEAGSDERCSTQRVLTGSVALVHVAEPSTSQAGGEPTRGATTSGRRSCTGVGRHGGVSMKGVGPADENPRTTSPRPRERQRRSAPSVPSSCRRPGHACVSSTSRVMSSRCWITSSPGALVDDPRSTGRTPAF
jgi:hypothetical protein